MGPIVHISENHADLEALLVALNLPIEGGQAHQAQSHLRNVVVPYFPSGHRRHR